MDKQQRLHQLTIAQRELAEQRQALSEKKRLYHQAQETLRLTRQQENQLRQHISARDRLKQLAGYERQPRRTAEIETALMDIPPIATLTTELERAKQREIALSEPLRQLQLEIRQLKKNIAQNQKRLKALKKGLLACAGSWKSIGSGYIWPGDSESFDVILQENVDYIVRVQIEQPGVDCTLSVYGHKNNLVGEDDGLDGDPGCYIRPEWTQLYRLVVSSSPISSGEPGAFRVSIYELED